MKIKKVTLALSILILVSCSTTRNNFFSRNYHQTTAKYNGYFNARESMRIGLEKIESSHKENYQVIIPINILYNIYQKQEQKNAYPNMDRVIEKTVKVIRRHSMDINGQETNKWIDDNYFLMAQARFYKQDYLSAINTFNYIIRKYPESELVNQSLIWSTKAHIKLDNQQTAENNLNYLTTEVILSTKEQKAVNEILAEHNIKKEKYETAIHYIKKSLIGKENREKKSRKHFILGQLYQKEEKGDSAIIHYNNVISLNPDYEMTFRAHLNKANAFAFSNNSSIALLKDYQKMLKDDKNKEYRDQIYYAIGEIYLNETDTVSGMENLNNSILSFLYNVDQKQQSHLKLAEIYFSQKDYNNTYFQYDSIMTIINLEDPNYIKIKRKHKQLKEVSAYQSTIATQDSLIYLASLPELERNQIIDDYIEALREKDMEARQTEGEDRGMNNFNLYEYNKNQNQTPNSGSWYFYNPSAMSFGYSEFLGRWGNRKLEDNWRRKDKNEINTEEEMEMSDSGPTEQEKYDRKYYIDQLPITEEKKNSSLELIENSYYKLGLALKDYFADYIGMIQRYNNMLEKFPKSEYKLLVFIHQMLAYQLLQMEEESNSMLSQIAKEFPDNKYVDTTTGLLIPQLDEKHETEYQQIFNLYDNQDYSLALELIKKTVNDGRAIEEVLKIKMIETFCLAALSGKQDYIISLEKILDEYPDTAMGERAKLFLDVLYGSFYETDADVYLTDFSSTHHLIISIEELSIDIPKTQSIITVFNNLFYSESELQVTNLLLNKNIQIIKVAKFDDKNRAMDYFETFMNHDKWIEFYKDKKINLFIISNPNFIQLFKEKELLGYKTYFYEKYLN